VHSIRIAPARCWRSNDPALPAASLAQYVSLMTYVYLLRNAKGVVYIGASGDLRQRVKAHQDGLCRTTKRYQPMELIYYEAFRDARDAWAREKDLKQYGGGYRSLMKRIGYSSGVPAAGRAG
jgi:putative endonuclease